MVENIILSDFKINIVESLLENKRVSLEELGEQKAAVRKGVLAVINGYSRSWTCLRFQQHEVCQYKMH